MIATSHVIIGGTAGVIAAKITQDPVTAGVIALAAGIVSHILCDLIPHLDHPPAEKLPNGDIVWTKTVYRFAYSDSILAFLLTLALWIWFFDFPALTPFALGALGGYLPDFIDNVPLWKDKVRTLPGLKQFHTLHRAVHEAWEWRFPMPEHWFLGTITQVIVVGACVWYLFL